jgi:hypothetical protein
VKKKRRSRAVNPKSLKMLEGVVQGLSKAEAGRRAGYAHPQSSFRAYERLKLEIPGRLNALGCPIDRVLKKVISKLDAQETEIGWFKGGLKQAVNVVAHDIQLGAADVLLKLHRARRVDMSKEVRLELLKLRDEMTLAAFERGEEQIPKLVFPASTGGPLGPNGH